MKIVYVSDSSLVSTGYGRVSRMLCTAFHEAGHNVTQIGWGYTGEPHNLPYKIIPCETAKDRFGEDILADLIRNEKPDVIFSLGDPWMLDFIPKLEESKTAVTVSYFPIDGTPIPVDWHGWINSIDVPVVFSKFAQDAIKSEVGKKVPLIYHGVETDKFIPLDKEVVKSNYGLDGKFVVGTVARNQPRKNLPALIKAFSMFAKNKPDVILYLHSQIKDVGWDLGELVRRFEITDKAFTTPNFSALNGIPDEQLVDIYNMFDLFCLPTMSEGFGLPIIEAQSCGVPVLVTNFSACPELVVDKQELIRVKDTLVMGRNIEQAIADVDDIVRKLNMFYKDWKNGGKKLKNLGELGRKKAEQIDWKIICNDFLDLLKQVEPYALRRSKEINPTFYKI